jgi:hypothetical protein
MCRGYHASGQVVGKSEVTLYMGSLLVGIELLNETSKSRVVMVLRRFPKRIWSQMELRRTSKRRA